MLYFFPMLIITIVVLLLYIDLKAKAVLKYNSIKDDLQREMEEKSSLEIKYNKLLTDQIKQEELKKSKNLDEMQLFSIKVNMLDDKLTFFNTNFKNKLDLILSILENDKFKTEEIIKTPLIDIKEKNEDEFENYEENKEQQITNKDRKEDKEIEVLNKTNEELDKLEEEIESNMEDGNDEDITEEYGNETPAQEEEKIQDKIEELEEGLEKQPRFGHTNNNQEVDDNFTEEGEGDNNQENTVTGDLENIKDNSSNNQDIKYEEENDKNLPAVEEENLPTLEDEEELFKNNNLEEYNNNNQENDIIEDLSTSLEDNSSNNQDIKYEEENDKNLPAVEEEILPTLEEEEELFKNNNLEEDNLDSDENPSIDINEQIQGFDNEAVVDIDVLNTDFDNANEDYIGKTDNIQNDDMSLNIDSTSEIEEDEELNSALKELGNMDFSLGDENNNETKSSNIDENLNTKHSENEEADDLNLDNIEGISEAVNMQNKELNYENDLKNNVEPAMDGSIDNNPNISQEDFLDSDNDDITETVINENDGFNIKESIDKLKAQLNDNKNN